MTTRSDVAERLFALRTVLAERVAVTTAERLPVYRLVDEHERVQTAASVVDMLAGALRDGRELGGDSLIELADYGRMRARQGVPLEDLSLAWRFAVRHVVEAIVELADDSTVALDLVRALSDRVDEATVAYTSGHHAAALDRARSEERLRAAFIVDLLAGRFEPVESRRGAAQFGLEPDGEYRAIRARGGDYAVLNAVEAVLSPGRQNCLLTIHDGHVVGVVSGAVDVDTDLLIAVGPAARLPLVDRSFRLASRILDVADELGEVGVQAFAQRCLDAAVAADQDLSRELMLGVLSPLQAAESADILIDTVETYLASGMRVDATATSMFIHPNTARYRLARFQDLSGCDLRLPERAFAAWWAIAAYRQSQARTS